MGDDPPLKRLGYKDGSQSLGTKVYHQKQGSEILLFRPAVLQSSNWLSNSARITEDKGNYPGGLEGSDGAQALIVLSTVPKGLAPAVSRAVATAVRTAASPLADHRAR